MSRWIDADDLIYRIRATISINTQVGEEYDSLSQGLMLCEKLVELKCPSIDIVRCKECKHWQEYKGEHFCHNVYGLHDDTKADDFCSYGVRKTNTTAEGKPTPIRDYMVHGEREGE